MVVKHEIYTIGVLLLASLGSCAMNHGTKDVTANSKSMNSEQSTVREVKLREAWEDKTKGLNKQVKDYSMQKLARAPLARSSSAGATGKK